MYLVTLMRLSLPQAPPRTLACWLGSRSEWRKGAVEIFRNKEEALRFSGTIFLKSAEDFSCSFPSFSPTSQLKLQCAAMSASRARLLCCLSARMSTTLAADTDGGMLNRDRVRVRDWTRKCTAFILSQLLLCAPKEKGKGGVKNSRLEKGD